MSFSDINKYCLALVSFVSLGLVSCNDASVPEPAGDETIVLKAKLKQSTVQLADGSKVTVNAQGKNYTYAMAADGVMTADGTGIVWNGEDFDIKAWTPSVDHSVTLTDQTSADKLSACDLLAAGTKATSRYVYLIFDHKMTRMTWNLRHVDSSYTQEQVDNARISFLGYGSVNFGNGEVSVIGNPDSEIAASETVGGGIRQGEAIMAPADMWGKPLIKVVIGGDEYFYTPDRADNADVASAAGDLVAGKWQKYNISISRKTLSVLTETSSVEWGASQEFGDGDIADAKLEAQIAADVTGKPGFTVSGIVNGYIVDREKGFSISYTEDAFGGLSWTGNCKVTRSEVLVSGNTTTQTYTFTDIKSDITVSYLNGVEAGDYLYDNGAWGKEENREGCKAIGRVFHVGLDSRDDSSYDLCKIRGYAVPLSFGNNNEMKWFVNQSDQKYIQALADIPVSADKSVRESYYGGYRLTGMLDSDLAPFAAEWVDQVPFWYAFKNIDMQAPTLSSGWYIPTYAQLRDVCASGMYDRFVGTYWSSQVYPGTGNVAVGGVEDGDKNTLWAIRCGADQAVGYGWAIDPAKLLPILTF